VTLVRARKDAAALARPDERARIGRRLISDSGMTPPYRDATRLTGRPRAPLRCVSLPETPELGESAPIPRAERLSPIRNAAIAGAAGEGL
jgi:hypothetical protein